MLDLRKFPVDRVLVSPSLLAADFGQLDRQIAEVTSAGADLLHLDIMDGHLVPNLSFGIPVIRSIRRSSRLLFDTHLMISEPGRYAKEFAAAGADHLTFHIECDEAADEVIKQIRATGCTVGMSLRPGTPAEALFPFLDRIDLVLVMTVEPGFGGQSFMPNQLGKLTAFKREIRRRRLPVRLEVDGGIDDETVHEVTSHGADIVVAGTAVFRHRDGMKTAIERLHQSTRHLDSKV